VLRRFYKAKKQLVMSFSGTKSYGSYLELDECHDVTISVYKHMNDTKCQVALKYHLMDTILHEIRHAWQTENHPEWAEESLDISDADMAYKYSRAEADAKAFALKNLHAAMETYYG